MQIVPLCSLSAAPTGAPAHSVRSARGSPAVKTAAFLGQGKAAAPALAQAEAKLPSSCDIALLIAETEIPSSCWARP
jgi:hypothetical protein